MRHTQRLMLWRHKPCGRIIYHTNKVNVSLDVDETVQKQGEIVLHDVFCFSWKLAICVFWFAIIFSSLSICLQHNFKKASHSYLKYLKQYKLVPGGTMNVIEIFVTGFSCLHKHGAAFSSGRWDGVGSCIGRYLWSRLSMSLTWISDHNPNLYLCI